MNKLAGLRASLALDLLSQIKKTAALYAQREAQLTRDLGERRVALNRSWREARALAESQSAAAIGSAEAAFSARTRQVQNLAAAREDRIREFENRTLVNLPERARKEKEAWMGALQMRDFEAKSHRTGGLDAAAAEYRAAAKDLGLERAELNVLSKRVRWAFAGYPWLGKALDAAPREGLAVEGADLAEPLQEIKAERTALRGQWLQKAFGVIPVFGWVLSLILAVFLMHWPAFLGYGLVVSVLYFIAARQAKPYAERLAPLLARARQIDAAAETLLADHHRARQAEIEAEYQAGFEELSAQWNRSDSIEEEYTEITRARLSAHVPRALARNEAMTQRRLAAIEAERETQVGTLQAEGDTVLSHLDHAHDAEMEQWEASQRDGWAELQTGWNGELSPRIENLEGLNTLAREHFPEWTPAMVEAWQPPETFPVAVPFGRVETDISASLPKDARLALPCSPVLSAPLALEFPAEGSLLLETTESAGEAASGVFNEIILRLLSVTPPGKVSFTIFDPVGLGENFAGLMQLADFEETLINRRIWTQRDQIDERLGEICEHLEKVIQMYLRNQYDTIADYNEQAGTVAEKYHFVVIADFPAAFSETAAARLESIVTSGARCGVFTLLHWDKRLPLPEDIAPEELRSNALTLRREGDRFVVGAAPSDSSTRVALKAPPAAELAQAITQKIGKASVDSNRVEVPFSLIAPPEAEFWKGDTTQELRIAIGRTGATKQQYLAIGKGTRQHALFAGKTGSGKSTLFHVIITNLALTCSPLEVEFYLIDFKKGVEFKCYAEKRLPHARVIAIESDREFALSVLQRVDEELKRRGDLFRALGVQDVPGYKRAGGKEPLPRTLLMIDEFQEFFVEDDAIAQTASLLFDRIVRQGRAFGIHVLLGTQTLGGSYSLARATLGQMVIRVALQCNEADAYLIMDESNAAPRLLSRPGEGIYNDAAGALEGNSPFQVVWLSDEERDGWLDKVHELAAHNPRPFPAPIVFEGNAPAAITDNEPLEVLLASRKSGKPAAPPAVGRAWLGAPNSIKGPTEALFQSQSGSNLLIVGQREEVALNLLGLALLALAAQYPAGAARFVFLHAATPGTQDGEAIEQLQTALPFVEFVRPSEAGEAINRLAQRLHSGDDRELVFCFIYGLHKFKKLRHEDDFSFSMSDDANAAPDPSAQFADLITEGASHGIHLLATFDTLNNVNRFLTRKALSEFEMRVIFQMSANDSASLVDSPKASTLGLHRALFYNEHEGTLETFRPYASPGPEWFREAAGAVGAK
ncbi:MAG: FtsK/SpoIIIE domain-containing protein [Chthoniobacteraceae bacterium]